MPRHQIVMRDTSQAPPVIGAEAQRVVTFKLGSGQAVKLRSKADEQARGAAVAHSALILEEMPSEKM